jgi:RNA polymerase sigma-70 factor (ECF subfamily)
MQQQTVEAVFTPHQDTELVSCALAGDEVARRELALKLNGRVRRKAARILRGGQDAEDAAQETWLEILRSFNAYRGVGSIERWADRITARSVIRYARKRRKEVARYDANADAADQQAPMPLPRRTEAIAHGALGGLSHLSSERQEALVLHHGYGYTVDEVASITGVSRNTVKDRLREGCRRVRALDS